MRTGVSEPKLLSLPVDRIKIEYLHRVTGRKVKAGRFPEPGIWLPPDHKGKHGGQGGMIQFREKQGGYVVFDGVNHFGMRVDAFEAEYATPAALEAEKAAAEAAASAPPVDPELETNIEAAPPGATVTTNNRAQPEAPRP